MDFRNELLKLQHDHHTGFFIQIEITLIVMPKSIVLKPTLMLAFKNAL